MGAEPEDMEEPCLCDCGEWVDLGDANPCSGCQNVFCPKCVKQPWAKCNNCAAEKCL